MSLFNSFDRNEHLGELATPLETQGAGVMTPAQRRNKVQQNIGGLNAFSSDGIVGGVGTSSAPYALGATAGFGLNYRFSATHTTGDMRAQYLRLDFNGAGGSGETLRAVANIGGVTVATGGTVNGAHLTLQFTGASAAVSGAGNALRATLGIGTGVTSPGGTVSVIQVDSDIASGVTVPAGYSFLRFTNSGTGTISKLMEVPTVASAGIFAVHTTQVMTHSIRIRSAAGTVYYLMVTDAATNRTGGA
jgi:hypothetical protein